MENLIYLQVRGKNKLEKEIDETQDIETKFLYEKALEQRDDEEEDGDVLQPQESETILEHYDPQ